MIPPSPGEGWEGGHKLILKTKIINQLNTFLTIINKQPVVDPGLLHCKTNSYFCKLYYMRWFIKQISEK
jgi:hypothetical protein